MPKNAHDIRHELREVDELLAQLLLNAHEILEPLGFTLYETREVLEDLDEDM